MENNEIILRSIVNGFPQITTLLENKDIVAFLMDDNVIAFVKEDEDGDYDVIRYNIAVNQSEISNVSCFEFEKYYNKNLESALLELSIDDINGFDLMKYHKSLADCIVSYIQSQSN